MSIQVQWDNEQKTVVRWDFTGNWKWDEFLLAQHESNKLLSSVDYMVDIIGNVEQSRLLPPSALTVYRSTLKNTAPNLGLIILVGSSPFIRQMVGIFMKISRFKGPGSDFRFADSNGQARTMIAAYRSRVEINE